MDVRHTTNRRVRLLLNDCGVEGYWIWCCLICHAYDVEGYFMKVTGDDIDLVAADICRTTPEQIWRVIESCIKRGLFDKEVYLRCSILTNDRMQLNYINATYDRRRKGTPTYFYRDHVVLTPQHLQSLGSKHLNNVFLVETNCSILEENAFKREILENSLFSGEKIESSGEKIELSPANDEFSKQKNKNKNKIYSNTNVLPSDDVTKKGIVGLKSTSNEEITELVGKKQGKKGKKGGRAPRKKKGRDPDSEPYWPLIRRVWKDFNLQHRHFDIEPMPSADYSHMHRVIENLRERAIGQGAMWTEQEALKRWEKFLSTAFTQDQWLHDHFEMAHLASKRQSIFNLIENGRTKTHTGVNGSASKSTSDSKINALAQWSIPVSGSDQTGKDKK